MKRMGKMHPIAHFKLITKHRRLVRAYCFRVGLYKQGLMHDLSKYSPVEFWTGAVYFQGDRSPNDQERKETGVSLAWLHHKGRNLHHFEYWVDYKKTEDGSFVYAGLEMPIRYVAEMFCDRVAASKIYLGDQYTDASPYAYFAESKERIPMHAKTMEELEKMLLILRDEGEDAAFAYVRSRLKKKT